jgi:hypothetical protein
MSDRNWNLEDDLKTVTLTVSSVPAVQIKLDAAGIDDLLKNLGNFRGAMKPEVPIKNPLGQKTKAVFGPAWATEPDIMRGDSLLHIRDPRYGWLHYLLPRSDAANLAKHLQSQVDTPLPEPPLGKPS